MQNGMSASLPAPPPISPLLHTKLGNRPLTQIPTHKWENRTQTGHTLKTDFNSRLISTHKKARYSVVNNGLPKVVQP